jgi:hypothetical protein
MVDEADLMLCPQCGGTMKIVAFITDQQAYVRIIDHLKLTFIAEKPPPSRVLTEVALIAAETSCDYFSQFVFVPSPEVQAIFDSSSPAEDSPTAFLCFSMQLDNVFRPRVLFLMTKQSTISTKMSLISSNTKRKFLFPTIL